MPHLPVIPNCFRATFIWSPVDSSHPVNVMHFSSSAGDEDSLAAALDSSWKNGMVGVVTGGTSIIRYDILALDGLSATRSYTPAPANTEGQDGQATGAPLLELALCVAFQTTERGPRKRGRIYLGPITENEITGPTFDGVDFGAIEGAWSDFNAAMVGTADAWLHGVASYKSGGVFTGIQSYRADQFPCTQRRRLTSTRH